MIRQYPCPACGKTIYFPEKCDLTAAKQEIACQNCHHKYHLCYWQILNCHKQRENLPVKKIYKTDFIEVDRYQITAINPEKRRPETWDFSIPTTADFSILSGNNIATLCVTTNSKSISIIDLDSGSNYKFYSLAKETFKRSLSWYAIASIVAILLVIIGDIKGELARYSLFLAAAFIGIYRGYVDWQKDKEIDSIELKRLCEEQNLLQQIKKLIDRIELLEDDRHQEKRSIERLKAIQQEAIGVGKDIYQDRIQTYDRGIAIIDRQTKLTEELIDLYQKVVSMLKIAHSTSQLEASLPDLDLNNSKIITKLKELDILEKKREELVVEAELSKILHQASQK